MHAVLYINTQMMISSSWIWRTVYLHPILQYPSGGFLRGATEDEIKGGQAYYCISPCDEAMMMMIIIIMIIMMMVMMIIMMMSMLCKQNQNSQRRYGGGSCGCNGFLLHIILILLEQHALCLSEDLK